MIKSKIDARERALELAVKCFDAQSKIGASNVVGFANVFEQYLIGDTALPEFVSGVDDILEAFEVMKKKIPDSNKQNNDSASDHLPLAPQGYKLITESETENVKSLLTSRGYAKEEEGIIFGSVDRYKKSFGGFDLHIYVDKRVGGYIVTSAVFINEGIDTPRFILPDYDLDIDRTESAASKLYDCYQETLNLNEGA